MPLLCTPLSAALGVEVGGVDLRAPLPATVADALRAALDAHHLLLFRAGDLEPEDQQRLLSTFGPLLDESRVGRGWTLVSSEPGGRVGAGPLLFHSDLAFTPEPMLVLSLYGLETPAGSARTWFANGVRAARLLPADLQYAVAGREAVHAYPPNEDRGDRRVRLADMPPDAPRARHPVLLPHPRTGVPVLYVNQMQTDSVSGLAERDSEALLARLWDRLYAEDNVYVHSWEPGDLVVWDNIALQHAREDLRSGDRRTLRRVPVGARVFLGPE